jgi:hypothetical protein
MMMDYEKIERHSSPISENDNRKVNKVLVYSSESSSNQYNISCLSPE